MHCRLIPALLLTLALACSGDKAGSPDGGGGDGADGTDGTDGTDGGDDTAPPVDETACPEAEARLGYPACVHRIGDDATFNAVTIASSSIDQLRVGKYLVPAVDDARVPPVFLYVDTFALHYDFLVTAFPDLFSGLTTADYEALVLHPETREFYGGTYSLYLSADGFFYGFTVWDDPSDATSTVTMADVTAAWEILTERFELDALSWVPYSSAQANAALTWTDAPFPIAGIDTDLDYEPYYQAVGYGTLRLYTLDDFDAASTAAAFGYQDIVAIDEAPIDIERVVSGIVTGTRQGDLSHLNIRSAGRGTPNCYIKDPLTALADYEGQLVRFECGADTWTVAAATPEEAAAWWDELRPDPVDICFPDTSVTDLPGLLELPTDTEEDRATSLCQYGSKGTNLATLYQRIDAEYQLDGFNIPMYAYVEFVNTNSWTVDLGSGEGSYTFQETLDAWIADPTFNSDGAIRQERLTALQEAMRAAPVNPAFITALNERIVEVFGDDTVMARFRSSSNAEDALGFNGAGLYDSASVCVADEVDGDSVGPSKCDADHEQERTVEDGIREVWSSLWNNRAWEERAWYGIDPSKVAMGVLCNTRSNDEQANAVAFSGNPSTDGDDRYLVNAQEGEIEVVSADPGVTPERDLLTVVDGEVTEILRSSASSEVPAGEFVLTDAELMELGGLLFEAGVVFPFDDVVPDDRDLLWDTEWKFDSDGQMKIKQIRPYLR